MSRLLLALLWLLHWLPYPLLGRIGHGLGLLLGALPTRRQQVVLRNLELCFPDWGDTQRRAVMREHFVCLARAFLDRAWLWWASPRRLLPRLQLDGAVDEALHGDGAVLLMGLHFEGMDAAWTAMTLHARRPLSGMYTPQKDKVMDAWVLRGRSRFRTERIVSRHEGAGGMLRALRRGTPFYTLPDMDFGARHSRFVDFCGVPAATLDIVPRLALSAKARVYPVVAQLLPGYRGYRVTVYPRWPEIDAAAARDDAALDAELQRINAFIAERVGEMPAQYHWVHRRFKTRPEGQPSLY